MDVGDVLCVWLRRLLAKMPMRDDADVGIGRRAPQHAENAEAALEPPKDRWRPGCNARAVNHAKIIPENEGPFPPGRRHTPKSLMSLNSGDTPPHHPTFPPAI